MKDVGRKGAERRPAGLEGHLVAGAEDEQLPRGRRALAACERHVEQHHALLAQPLGQARSIAWRNGGAHGDDQPGSGCLHHAAGGKQHRFDFVVEADHDDYRVARARHFARRVEH